MERPERNGKSTIDVVEALEPDVTVLTECRLNQLDGYVGSKLERGWNVAHAMTSSRIAAVVVASRHPIEGCRAVGYHTAPERMLLVDVAGLRVLGVYLQKHASEARSEL